MATRKRAAATPPSDGTVGRAAKKARKKRQPAPPLTFGVREESHTKVYDLPGIRQCGGTRECGAAEVDFKDKKPTKVRIGHMATSYYGPRGLNFQSTYEFGSFADFEKAVDALIQLRDALREGA